MSSVVVVGGGPAGCAFALTAARAGHDVVLIDEQRRRQTWPGEALPAGGKELVDSIFGPGLLAEHGIAHGTAAAWGSDQLVANDFMTHWSGHGWHLDRSRFDADLRDRVRAAGVDVAVERLTAVGGKPGEWRVNERWLAEWVIDASGRAGAVVGRLGVPLVRFDDQVALIGVAPDRGGERVTTVESTRIGWWYTAPLPGGMRVAALVTDSDLVEPDRQTMWQMSLAMTRHIADIVGQSTPHDIGAYPAGSRHRAQFFGTGWIAVGDTAMAFDPLSGQGLITGLVMAAHAGHGLNGDLNAWAQNYQGIFDEHQLVRASFYKAEQRWRDEPFWKRRLLDDRCESLHPGTL
jgi:flavin-dependent dehydrogenase